MVVVTAANITDRDGAQRLLAKVNQRRQQFPRLVRIWVDGGYSGEDFCRQMMDCFRWILEVVSRRLGVKALWLYSSEQKH